MWSSGKYLKGEKKGTKCEICIEWDFGGAAKQHRGESLDEYKENQLEAYQHDSFSCYF